MKNIAIITARSGSKGIRDKNIRPLNGMPLMAYSIRAAKESGVFEEIMVSTDSQRYVDIAREYGASVPFLRSEEMSSDTAKSWDVVLEVLEKYRELGRQFDTVCILQPTSPLRTGEDIVGAYELLHSRHSNAVTSVCEVDHSPLWCMTLGDDLSLDEFNATDDGMPRQKLPTYYRQNGALYIRRIVYEEDMVMLQNKNDLAYIMPREHSVDIDGMLDFVYAEQVIRLGNFSVQERCR